MDKLGLEEPQTLEEAFDVIEAFRKTEWVQHLEKILSDWYVILHWWELRVVVILLTLFFRKFGANPQRWAKG